MQDPVGVYAAYYVTHSDVCPDLDLMRSIRYSLVYISGSISHVQHPLLISSYVFPDLVYPDLVCPDPYAPPSCARPTASTMIQIYIWIHATRPCSHSAPPPTVQCRGPTASAMIQI